MGSTNGTVTAARSSDLPGKSSRANTYAPGSATASVSTVDAVACHAVNQSTDRTSGSVTTSQAEPSSPSPTIDATGYAKNTARNATGTTSNAARHGNRAPRPAAVGSCPSRARSNRSPARDG